MDTVSSDSENLPIFHYHPETGIYVGQGFADPSPFRPNEWLIPASATIIAPPNPQDGYVAVFNVADELWEMIQDHRHETWWLDGVAVIITFIGNPAYQGYRPDGPPEPGPKEVVQWSSEANDWVRIPDHRGETWWKNGMAVVIQELGDPAESGFSSEGPPVAGEKEIVVWDPGNGWMILPDRRGEIWWMATNQQVMVISVGDPAANGWFAENPKPDDIDDWYWEQDVDGYWRGGFDFVGQTWYDAVGTPHVITERGINPNYDGWTLEPPPPPPPIPDPEPATTPLTARQFRLMFSRNGHPLTQVVATIAAIEPESWAEEVQIYWEYEPTVDWSAAEVQAIIEARNISESNAAAWWMTASAY